MVNAGELEWEMGGGHVWPDETCDYTGGGTVPIGTRSTGTPFASGSISPSSDSGLAPGASYSLASTFSSNGGSSPRFDLDCTDFDSERVYVMDPWLTVRTSSSGDSAACEWSLGLSQSNVGPQGSLTDNRYCRNDTSRTLPNGTDHQYTFESRVSWSFEPSEALPADARR